MRDGLRLAATDSVPTASLSWTAPTEPTEWSSPTIDYALYRNGARHPDDATTVASPYTDMGLMQGVEYAYQVAVLVNGVEQRRGNIARIGGYDTDGDGLIAIENLAQLNAIRWDMDGDGVPSTGNETDYAAAFPAGEGTVCPAGRNCAGYELMADLNFDSDDDGDVDADDHGGAYWNDGMGWQPIGAGLSTYSGTLEGNGHTISNLFINRSGGGIGLFGPLGATVRNLGLVNVNVAGGKGTGALAGEGLGGGRIISSYATGRVSGSLGVGGLVGRHLGSVSASFAAVSITATGDGGGGLVGRLEQGASVTDSYATGTVTGADGVGGLVGSMEPTTEGGTTVTASYATGPVRGRDEVGGLVGSNVLVVDNVDVSGTITASYHDAETSGVAVPVGDGPAGTAAAQTTSELQSPTDATGIYATWSADAWDFGTASQYPALKTDFSDADRVATWPEFGYQVRDGLALTATANVTEASLAWTPPATLPSQWGSPAITYTLYRNGERRPDDATLVTSSHTDTGLVEGPEYAYQVAVLLDGVEHRRSNVARVGGYDQDGDGLIEIRTLAQLNAIRWDMDGDGMPTDDEDTTFDETTLYAEAFPNGDRPVCPAGTDCTGYELMADLDFDTGTAGDRTDDTYHGGGAGWDPIGDSVNQFSAEFQGNGHTIANLFILRAADTNVGLFGVIDTTAVIRQVGVTNALVSGQDLTGALLGASLRGQVHDSYATGTVIGSEDGIGGLVGGFQGGELTGSYASVAVSGENQVGGLVGNVETSTTASRLTAVYAVGPVTGTGDDVGGLMGRLDARGVVTASYATGTVTGTGDNVGGLVGNLVVEGSNAGTITDSYYDTETSGQHAGHGPRTTAELQSPTGADGIYADWRNIDLDGDGMADPEDTNDFWHFGTGSQYPALKIDFNGNNAATWPEFGFQIRDGLALRQTNDSLTAPNLSWTQSTTPAEWGSTTIAYRVYRNGVAAVDSQIGTTHSDTGLTEGPEYAYQVAALLDGVELRRGNIVRIGGHDQDGDGLIAIENLAQLNAIRWDLDGNGVPTDDSLTSVDETALYAAAFPSGDGPVCPAGRKCVGYELLADLDFDENGDGQITSADAAYWDDGAGWATIGDGYHGYYDAAFDGNGHTISNLFINRTTTNREEVGLFGGITSSSSVRDLGLVNVSVTGLNKTGALAGTAGGAITGVYASGQVNGTTKTGGLVGQFNSISNITASYSTAAVSGTTDVGGLVGDLGAALVSTVIDSYATGPVSGTVTVGGLVGNVHSQGVVTASYATGPVSGSGNVGGLVGYTQANGTITNSYYDTDTSGVTGGVGAMSTAALQSPTDASGIYADWSAETWDFGAASQYPVIKTDFNGDNTASWPEFGFQIRDGLALEQTNDSLTAPDLSWTQSTTPAQWGSPALAYQIYRNGAAQGDPQGGRTYSDTGLTEGPEYAYQVAALLDGVELRRGNIVRIGGYDQDGDGLIEIQWLEQLDAIRYDDNGDGVPSSDHDIYAAAFPSGDGPVCPAGRTCTGYELMRDLDFNQAGSYASGTANTAWTDGEGWLAICPVLSCTGTFQGNGMTISNLFVNRTTDAGLFGGVSGAVSNLGLLNVNVSGADTGALAADSSGTITGVYSTGKVSGSDNVGGLVGSTDGTITSSYSTVAVTSSGDNTGGLVGSVGFTTSSISNSYATGPVSGTDRVGGLVGEVQASGTITNSYATGLVSGTGSDVGGLVGHTQANATITNSYYDTETAGQSGGTGPQSTAALTTPTSNTGILAMWSLDDWDFGTGSQYPAIKADFNGDNTASWPEFGFQLREAPAATVSTDGTDVTVSWNAVDNTHWTPNPALTYQVYKGDATLGSPVTGTSAVDSGFSAEDDLNTQYRVAALLDGVPARTGSPDRLGAPTVTAVATENLSEDNPNAGGVTLTLSRALLSGEWVIVTYMVIDPDGQITAADINESIDVTGMANTHTATSGSSVRIPITAVNDNIAEVAETGLLVDITAIAFRPKDGNADGSDDVDLLATAPAGTGDDKTLALMDNDVAPTSIVLTLDPDSVMEDAGQTNINVTAKFPDSSSALPGVTNVSVTVAAGGARYSINNSSFTLTIPAGSLSSPAGTFMITPVNDSDSQPALNIAVSGMATVSGASVATTSQLRLIDDDQPSVTFSLTPTTIAESGGSATLRAAISLAVSSTTTITVSADPASAVQLSGTTLTIPANQENSSGSITITAVNNDVDAPDASVALSGALPPGTTGITAPLAVTLTITDDDARGVTVSETGRTVGENGGQATYTIRLNSQPTGTVTVTPQSSDASIATVSGPLTFTAGNWQTPQTVTVTGVNDNVDNASDRRDTTITHTIAGGDYAGVSAADVSVQVNDDDATPDRIILTASPASIAEDADSAASVTITAAFPQGSATRLAATAVTVSQTGGTATSGTDYATITPASVTITIPVGSTSAAATTAFTVDPTDDEESEGRETIVFGAATPPAGFTVTPAVFTINDDDISAMIESINPSPLTERTLDGARLTVKLTATEYVSALSPAHFELQPETARLSIASVSRESHTRAVLTLAFRGDIDSNLGLKVHVRETANEDDVTLITDAVAVTQAPTPDQVMGVTTTPGPGSLTVAWNTVDHADGYVVEWWPASDPDNASSRRVADGSTTRTTISDLPGETQYMARVKATSNFAPDGPPSAETATTTMPAHAIVSSTNPSPLTERNLDGATLTVEFLGRPYRAWWRELQVSHFTASGVPGVSVNGVERLSDRQARVTLAYDDTDFDADRTLLIRIDGLAFNYGGHISAVTGVQAVVEAPPAQVQNVRATGGTRQVQVRWDGVPTAYENLDKNVYRVQWKGPGQSWRERKVRGSQTAMTIQGLSPGTEYTVRVIATRHKADDGPPSAEARATTVKYRAWLSGTEPAELTEANLRGAALQVDLQGSSWILQAAGRDNRPMYTVSGVPGVYVERVERVSASRVKVILGYRGEDFDENQVLRLKIRGMHTWRKEINLETEVKAVNEELMNVRATGGDQRVDVEWDEIDGASAYRLEWRETNGQGYSNNRAIVTPANWYPIRELNAGTHYTVRVRAWVRYKGYGDWVEATATTNPAPAQPKQTAGVTVSDAELALTEGGSGATYTVVLDGQPTANVTITASSDNGDVTTQPASLTFTPDNWQTPQTVTVRATHDDDAVDDSATISHAVSGADEYAGIAVAAVSVTVTDDDTAGITATPSSLSVREGDAATYQLSLTAQPLADVSIFVVSHSADVTAQPAEITFTPDNWQNAQTVTVRAAQDDDRTDGEVFITHGLLTTTASGYDGVTVPNVIVAVTDDDSDRAVLETFYQATGGSGWTNNASWLSDKPLNQWHGVSTNGQGQVTQLVLRDNNLSGSLPATLGNLESLQVLSLDRNSIGGSLPTELGNLSNLTRLAMNRNSLSGSIPSQLGNLSNLSIIGLARNSLSGSLPTSLGNLSGLTKVSLHDNTALSGALPSGFTNLANLQRLAVANTGLCAPAGEAFSDWLDTVDDLTPSAADFPRCQ